MDPTLKSKILNQLKTGLAGFSPRMQMVAKYILDHPTDFGLDPVRQTAEKAGVSTFSLVRAAKTLGFDSFTELRAPFRHALVAAPLAADRPTVAAGDADPMRRAHLDSMANSIAISRASLDRLRPDQIETAVDLMLSARTAYVTAVRSSYAIAYFLHYVGRMAVPGLQLIPRHMSSAIDELNGAGPDDVMVAITISPYSRETIDACRFAQSRGVRLILISDSAIVAPDLKPAVAFEVTTLSTHHFACFSGLMAVVETLLAAMVARGGEPARARIESYEALRDSFDAYWPSRKKQ